MKLFHVRQDCRACGSNSLDLAFPLNPLPVHSPNIGLTPDMAAREGMRDLAPLDMYLCRDCGHLQLTAVIDPKVQYDNFLYVTSISLGLTEHYRRSVDEILARTGIRTGRVLEIGSNDGTLLRFFKERGFEVLGVDPARKTAEAATAAGIPTLARFFGETLGREIAASHGAFDLVIANNTLANLDDLDDTARGLKAVMAPGGAFVFETSYGADVARKALLDTIYHEHLSYFMVKPLKAYFERHGMSMFDVHPIATKGGSIRGYAQPAGAGRAVTPGVAEMLAQERADGLDRTETYRRVGAALGKIKADLTRAIDDCIAKGRKVAAYGASVGSVTLIQQWDLGTKLSVIYDDSPLQKAISGPGYSIPVMPSENLPVDAPGLVVILAWRYADPIVAKHARYAAAGGRFAVPFPSVAIR